ncbi:hypothetical protein FSP39_013573 [Pinctada imbricata]|uniref:Uncharacterized protein n=1 Tax=Pinctada imbricata TaxID=66713 RepID=A0AA88YMX8_PINIB|nr:hypothetical protein FSP39_013573 [Pinctada imbricata]
MASRSCRGKNDTGTSSRETDSASKEQLKSYIPLKASSWKQGHLREIGIFYDEKCSNLDEIISRLKEQLKVRHTLADLPNIGKRLVQLTKEIWTFSVDLSEKSAETITYGNRETNHLVQKFASEDNELRAQFRNSSGEER